MCQQITTYKVGWITTSLCILVKVGIRTQYILLQMINEIWCLNFDAVNTNIKNKLVICILCGSVLFEGLRVPVEDHIPFVSDWHTWSHKSDSTRRPFCILWQNDEVHICKTYMRWYTYTKMYLSLHIIL